MPPTRSRRGSRRIHGTLVYWEDQSLPQRLETYEGLKNRNRGTSPIDLERPIPPASGSRPVRVPAPLSVEEDAPSEAQMILNAVDGLMERLVDLQDRRPARAEQHGMGETSGASRRALGKRRSDNTLVNSFPTPMELATVLDRLLERIEVLEDGAGLFKNDRQPDVRQFTIPDLAARYPYIAARREMHNAALAGRFPAEKLHLLIDPLEAADLGSNLLDDHNAGWHLKTELFPSEKTHHRLLAAIPSFRVFSHVWRILLEFQIATLTSLCLISETVAAYHWHASSLETHSLAYPWECVLRYHIAVARLRSASGFVPAQWYRQHDAAIFDRECVRRSAAMASRAPLSSSHANNANASLPASSSAARPSHSATTGGPSAARNLQVTPSMAVCNNYNAGRPCFIPKRGKSCPFVHRCARKGCEGEHRATECTMEA